MLKYTEITIVSRTVKTLNKTSLNKIKFFCDNYEDIIVDFESFNKYFLNTITYDNRSMKDCSERAIVTFYIEECEKLFETYNIDESIDIDDDFYITLSNDMYILFYDSYTRFNYRFMYHLALIWVDSYTIDKSSYLTMTIRDNNFIITTDKIRGKTIHKKGKS